MQLVLPSPVALKWHGIDVACPLSYMFVVGREDDFVNDHTLSWCLDLSSDSYTLSWTLKTTDLILLLLQKKIIDGIEKLCEHLPGPVTTAKLCKEEVEKMLPVAINFITGVAVSCRPQ